jgi:hypothetical protein
MLRNLLNERFVLRMTTVRRPVPEIDEGGSGRRVISAHRLDLSVGHHNEPGLHDAPAGAVKHTCRPEYVRSALGYDSVR